MNFNFWKRASKRNKSSKIL